MKKILKLSLVLAVVLIAMNVRAGGIDFSLDVKKGQGKRITFSMNEINNISLSIYDANDKLINKEKIASNGNFNRTYDLKALPEGTYFLEAESEMKIARYEISVVGETASLSSNIVSQLYKPVFTDKNGLVSLSILNPGKSPVTIKIYDADENEVYASANLTDQNVNKFFDLKTVAHEKHTFVMTYDNKVFTKTVAAK